MGLENDFLRILLSGIIAVMLSVLSIFLRFKRLENEPIRLISRRYSADIPEAIRIRDLSTMLNNASLELGRLLPELEITLAERQLAISELEARINDLMEREQTLNEQVTALENTSPEVATYFGQLINQNSQRDARRDIVFFVAGIVMSTVIEIGLRLLLGS